ncbi:MAG: RNA polymerase sigma factor [Phycisphaerae bacterium]|nr:RNA polymerase sigma factor [Phycisphaerae bacterium]
MGDDAQLMSRVAGGQDDAFTILIDRWRARVWAFIDRMCGRLGRTDDIFQDVWMRIYLYRDSYDPGRTFKSYLFRVVVNCCRTNMAKDLPKHAACPAYYMPNDSTEPDSLSNEPEPLDALIGNEQYRHVRQAVDLLPEKQRTVVLLYLLYDSDYSLIAETLKLRKGTVRSHMSLALKNLRRILVHKSPTTEPLAKGQVPHE